MLRLTVIVFGTFVGGLTLYVAATTRLGIVGKEPWMSVAFFASFIIMGAGMALVTRRLVAAKPVENLEQMEQRGMLVHEKYEARRAFQMEEFEDEGCQYFVELKNGSVLFLCGQYLYDYEPADGKWQAKRARKFPCTEFTVLRHKELGWVVDVNCAGVALEPECEAPPFDGEEDVPADGVIISNRSYDEIKREMMKRVSA